MTSRQQGALNTGSASAESAESVSPNPTYFEVGAATGQVTHEAGQHLPDWSLDAEHGGIIVLGSTDIDSGTQFVGWPATCPHFAPMAISSIVPARCRRRRGHDGAHEIVMVWLP